METNLEYPSFRHKVYIAYDHAEDSEYYRQFHEIFCPRVLASVHADTLQGTYDADPFVIGPDHIINRLIQNYFGSMSINVVLCGRNSWGLKYIDWEIFASLQCTKGLLGIILPTIAQNERGKYKIPLRLYDNIKSGYAKIIDWNTLITEAYSPMYMLATYIEAAIQANTDVIDNRRKLKLTDERVAPAEGRSRGLVLSAFWSRWMPV
ncbi:MAG: TIR domain-containing protein [Chloroflexi bacterium]|nr:TIR domain-containing protein [Chloroflexota bacterium]